MKRQSLLFALACALLLGATAPARAQVMPEERILFRVSPIGLVFTTYKAGMEFMITPTVAADAMVNVNRNWFWTDINVTTGMIGARYYPTAAFRGFSAAGHLGGIQIDAEESVSGGLFHIELAYSWLLGEAQRFYVGTGVGAMRVFASGTIRDPEDEDFDWDLAIPIPSARLQIGYRF
jgi:hypothetical protein